MSAGSPRRWHAEHALLPSGPARAVLLEVADGRFTAVTPDSPAGDAERLAGVVLPGLANAHSHAFHRALRGRTHGGGGTFWSWREGMYAVAARLDPDSYLALARATFAEMALAGVTCVGEFHYLHHRPGGGAYDDPNAMGEALRQAASEAGIRITLLDACYLAGGLTAGGHTPLDERQRRFGDGTVERWAERLHALRPSPGMRVGAAIHSVRAVPREGIGAVARAAEGLPLHVHLSEQPAENDACQGFYGVTPTGLLDAEGALGPADHRGPRHPPDRRQTSPRSAAPAPPAASAPPPSATSPTASARPAPCSTPGRRCPSAPTSTRSSTCSRRRARWRCTSG